MSGGPTWTSPASFSTGPTSGSSRSPRRSCSVPAASGAGRGPGSGPPDARCCARDPRYHDPAGRASLPLKLPRLFALALAVPGAACGSASEQGGRVHALVTFPRQDTVRFEAPARARRCGGGPGKEGLLLQGSADGNGVMRSLRGSRGGTPAAGPWPLLQRGDTVSPRGATVGVRYMMKDVARGFALDSGVVEVRATGAVLTVVARGTGLETAEIGRAHV